jgi:hypothetical protein
VTLGFEEVEALEMEGFGAQNVLDDLVSKRYISSRGGRFRSRCPTTASAEASAAGW